MTLHYIKMIITKIEESAWNFLNVEKIVVNKSVENCCSSLRNITKKYMYKTLYEDRWQGLSCKHDAYKLVSG